MFRVTDAKQFEGYRPWVRLSDKTEGEIDLSDLVTNDKRPIFATLRDLTKFAALRAEMDTVVWDNGFDLAPEYLHARFAERAFGV